MNAAGTIGSLYQAFLDADEAALARCVGDTFELHSAIPGALAGPHRGAAGLCALRRRLTAVTGDTFRPWRPDSRDVALSEHHAVLMDRWVGEVGAAKLDAHVAIVFGLDGARPEIGFLYVQNPAALDCLR
jgi:hypothetical protein